MLRTILTLLACAALPAESVTIQVLATTDMHGNLMPWDYYTAKPAPRGLAKVATLIKQARAANPNTILIDNGDTIQGTPLEALHQSTVQRLDQPDPDPMMATMNKLGYAAMTIGNHEFNFGLKSLNRARQDAAFPWLSGNTAARSGSVEFPGYIVKTVGGVKVGIFGITTPNIPNWEKPENYAGYTFRGGVEASRELVAKLRAANVDLIIGSIHAGLAPKSGETFENMADSIAKEVPGIAAIVFGHTHQDVEDLRVNGVLMVQPGRWAERLGVLNFMMEREGTSAWRIKEKSGKLLKVTADTPIDPEIAAIAKPYHDAAEKWLATPIATSDATLDARLGRVQDTALVDAVHEVQMHYAKADVSFTSLFNPRARINAGPVTIREIAALYLYENELYAVEGTGATVKAALENAARYYLQCAEPTCSSGPLTNRSMAGYNFDMAQGVDYEIDLSQPYGQRVKNLRYKSQELRPEQILRIAVNNYRAGGSNGYTMFKSAPIVWKSNREIRDLMIDYYTEHKKLPTKPNNNWRIVPEAALKVLERESANP